MASNPGSYFASDDVLPSRLPTLAEIHSSEVIISDQKARQVVGVGEHFIVKYGAQINLQEGRTMLHVSRNTSVPVPKVYALFQDAEKSKSYIVMEGIHGQTWEEAWSTLTEAQKQDIAAKLKTAFDDLRKLSSPGGFCAIENGPLPDDLFWNLQLGPSSAQDRPFDSEESLNSGLLKRYRCQHPQGKVPQILHGHPPTFHTWRLPAEERHSHAYSSVRDDGRK